MNGASITLPDDTGDKRFQPGQSGNLTGRPKGARKKISEKFLEALANHFEVQGESRSSEALQADSGHVAVRGF
jgi:hypothetical protein